MPDRGGAESEDFRMRNAEEGKGALCGIIDRSSQALRCNGCREREYALRYCRSGRLERRSVITPRLREYPCIMAVGADFLRIVVSRGKNLCIRTAWIPFRA